MVSNSNPVAGAPTTDVLLKSIRTQLRARRSSTANGPQPDDPVEITRLLEHVRMQLNPAQLSGENFDASPAPFAGKPQDLSRIATELESALTAHRQFGQVNPRLPGLHNRAFQLLKKAMRRSLTWYTRPLQHFQGAVLRSLQLLSAIVQNHGDSLRKVDDKLNRSALTSQRQMADMKRELDALRSELLTVKEEIRKDVAKRSD